MFRHPLQYAVLFLLICCGTPAQAQLDDIDTNTITTDSTYERGVNVGRINTGAFTVSVRDGAVIGGVSPNGLRTGNNATIEITGGTIYDEIQAAGNVLVTMSGGHIARTFGIRGFGTFGALSRLDMTGGIWDGHLRLENSATANIFGGSFGNTGLIRGQTSEVGGPFDFTHMFNVTGNSTLSLFGSNLLISNPRDFYTQPIRFLGIPSVYGGTYYDVSGNLTDGTAVSGQALVSDQGKIILPDGTKYFPVRLPEAVDTDGDGTPDSFQFDNVPGNGGDGSSGPGGGNWFDPPTAYGFEYSTTDGTSLFAAINDFPTGFNNPFTVVVGGASIGSFLPGQSVDFSTFAGGGVSSFQITGLNPLVDGGDPLAFPVKLSFTTPTASFSMTPLTATAAAAPEPTSIALLLLGLSVARGARRTKRSTPVLQP